jgi:hypothetical protein
MIATTTEPIGASIDLREGAWIGLVGEHRSCGAKQFGPHGCYCVLAVLRSFRWPHGNAEVLLWGEDTGIVRQLVTKWDVCPPQGRIAVRCCQCHSDNSGGVNAWTGSFSGSACRCWDGDPDYAYLGRKPADPVYLAINGDEEARAAVVAKVLGRR